MTVTQRNIALAVLILTAGLAAPVRASEFCLIKQTADGFVALRSGPGAGFGRVAKMAPGDEVMPSPLPAETKGRWQKVKWWRGQERMTRGFEKPSGQGWVHRDLMEDCG